MIVIENLWDHQCSHGQPKILPSNQIRLKLELMEQQYHWMTVVILGHGCNAIVSRMSPTCEDTTCYFTSDEDTEQINTVIKNKLGALIPPQLRRSRTWRCWAKYGKT